jgi:hypothetical protein
VIGFDPFADWVRTGFIPKWAQLCGAAGLTVPPVLVEDPGAHRPAGHWLLLSTLKGSTNRWRWVFPGGVQTPRYRTLGRMQGDLHLKGGSGPRPADRYADVWREVWGYLTSESVRPAGVRFYSPSGANEQGSTGTHTVWVMDVPFRYDEI